MAVVGHILWTVCLVLIALSAVFFFFPSCKWSWRQDRQTTGPLLSWVDLVSLLSWALSETFLPACSTPVILPGVSKTLSIKESYKKYLQRVNISLAPPRVSYTMLLPFQFSELCVVLKLCLVFCYSKWGPWERENWHRRGFLEMQSPRPKESESEWNKPLGDLCASLSWELFPESPLREPQCGSGLFMRIAWGRVREMCVVAKVHTCVKVSSPPKVGLWAASTGFPSFRWHSEAQIEWFSLGTGIP